MAWFKSNKVETRIANILKGTSDPVSFIGDNGQLYLKYGSYEKHYFMGNKIVVVENKNDATDLKLYIVGLTKSTSGILITDTDLLAYLSDITNGYLKGCSSYDTADSTTQTGILAIGDWGSGMTLHTYIPGWTQYKAGTFYGVIDLTQSPVPTLGYPTYQENPFVDPDTIVESRILDSFAKVNGQWQDLIGTDIDDINATTNVNKYYLGQLIERVIGSSLKITDSGHDGDFYPYYAFNGISPSDLRNPNNCWSATQDDANAWIQYDFDRFYWFNKIAIKCFSNYSDAWVGNIKVLGSQDGITWENALINATNYEITAPLQDFATIEIPLNDAKEYQHIRIQADDNAFTVYYAPSCFFDEIYVYGGITVVPSVNFKQGTFVSASSQFGIVNVNVGFKPDLVMVKLPFTGGDTVSYWEKGLSYAQNSAIWCLKPVEDVAYEVALGRVDGETGIQAINDNGFSFMSNGWNTLNVTCEYIAVQYEAEPAPIIPFEKEILHSITQDQSGSRVPVSVTFTEDYQIAFICGLIADNVRTGVISVNALGGASELYGEYWERYASAGIAIQLPSNKTLTGYFPYSDGGAYYDIFGAIGMNRLPSEYEIQATIDTSNISIELSKIYNHIVIFVGMDSADSNSITLDMNGTSIPLTVESEKFSRYSYHASEELISNSATLNFTYSGGTVNDNTIVVFAYNE